MKDRLRAVECPADFIDQIRWLEQEGCRGELWSRLPSRAVLGLDGEGRRIVWGAKRQTFAMGQYHLAGLTPAPLSATPELPLHTI